MTSVRPAKNPGIKIANGSYRMIKKKTVCLGSSMFSCSSVLAAFQTHTTTNCISIRKTVITPQSAV